MDFEDKLTSSDSLNEAEVQGELTIRPQRLDDYIGQEKLKKELKVYIEAAKQRQEALDHVLLFGPPGLGKTTLAQIIAHELGANIKTTTGPAVEKPGDLVATLNELQPGDVLFIDEIHRLPMAVEEILYSAMEDYYIDIIVGQGPAAHPVHFPLPPFTLIGATTKAGMLSAPLRARFGIIGHMQYYSIAELSAIINRSAQVFATQLTPAAAGEIASRSRGTPRIANRFLKRIRDFAQVQHQNGIIDTKTVDYALNLLRVDKSGLDDTDRRLLEAVIMQYDGGPVGLKTLAANLSEESDTVAEVIEPYLLQHGFLQRTSRGRVATKKAYEHLGLAFPQDK